MWQFIRLVHKLEDLLNQPRPFPSPDRLISVLYDCSTLASCPQPYPPLTLLFSAIGGQEAGKEDSWWPNSPVVSGPWCPFPRGVPGSCLSASRVKGIVCLLPGAQKQGPRCCEVATEQPEWNPNTFIPRICGIYFFINSGEAVRKVAGFGDNLYE